MRIELAPQRRNACTDLPTPLQPLRTVVCPFLWGFLFCRWSSDKTGFRPSPLGLWCLQRSRCLCFVRFGSVVVVDTVGSWIGLQRVLSLPTSPPPKGLVFAPFATIVVCIMGEGAAAVDGAGLHHICARARRASSTIKGRFNMEECTVRFEGFLLL